MSGMTKGAFLKEKMCNMARWIEADLGKENLPVGDLPARIEKRTELECSVLATSLQSNKNVVLQRNWSGLVQQPEVPSELQGVLHAIQRRPEMHEKFWRYMKLFIDVVD